jgi:DedD protein
VPARPSAQVLEHKPAPVATPSGVSRLFSGFLLQAGVFTSVQRAEELHARLTLSGVPSTLETRVQVGPFRTRQEAEAAQAKLKELGVETILVPPKGKN